VVEGSRRPAAWLGRRAGALRTPPRSHQRAPPVRRLSVRWRPESPPAGNSTRPAVGAEAPRRRRAAGPPRLREDIRAGSTAASSACGSNRSRRSTTPGQPPGPGPACFCAWVILPLFRGSAANRPCCSFRVGSRGRVINSFPLRGAVSAPSGAGRRRSRKEGGFCGSHRLPGPRRRGPPGGLGWIDGTVWMCVPGGWPGAIGQSHGSELPLGDTSLSFSAVQNTASGSGGDTSLWQGRT
jgi:hypothetical protein